MAAVYEMNLPPEIAEVVEAMRIKIADVAGVTHVGNRITVRFYLRKQLVDVHMIISKVTTVKEAESETCKECGTPYL